MNRQRPNKNKKNDRHQSEKELANYHTRMITVVLVIVIGGLFITSLLALVTWTIVNNDNSKPLVFSENSINSDNMYAMTFTETEGRSLVHMLSGPSVQMFVTQHANGPNAIIVAHGTFDEKKLFLSRENGEKACIKNGKDSLVCSTYLNMNSSFPVSFREDVVINQTEISCYVINNLNARLNSEMDWTIDSTNPYQLNSDWIQYITKAAMDIWQQYTSYFIWGRFILNHQMGPINSTIPCNFNGFRFATIEDKFGHTNTILAVTITWFDNNDGPWRIIRWNQLYNTAVNRPWGDVLSDSALNDLRSTITHELGHAAGLGDVYSSECSQVTMYYQGGTGEAHKRSLETADITALQTLYGSITSAGIPPRKISNSDPVPPVYFQPPPPPPPPSSSPVPGTSGSIITPTTATPKKNSSNSLQPFSSFILLVCIFLSFSNINLLQSDLCTTNGDFY